MSNGLSALETVAFLVGGISCVAGALFALRWRNCRTALLSLILAAILLSVPALTTPISSQAIKIDLPINDKR